MTFTKNTLVIAAAMAVASSITLEDNQLDQRQLAQTHSQDLVLDVAEGVTEIFSSI